MILTLLCLLISSAQAQGLTELRELSQLTKPSPIFSDGKEPIKLRKNINKYDPVYQNVGLEEILSSPEELAVLKPGTYIYRLDNSQKLLLDKDIYIRFHRLPDEQGFKYLVNKNGDILFKARTEDIHSIAPETVMYEPPHSYTPAPEREKILWDGKLKNNIELALAVSMMRADFLQDLLNLDSAPTGQMNHIGVNYLADWKWPVKVGLAAYYQRARYNTDGGTTNFSSVSFGPVFKTKNFYPLEVPVRLQAQIRYSPFGKMDVNISRGSTGFDFNTTDLVVGIEFPLKNRWGEFVLSLFTHYQWMSLKNQEEIVNIESSSKPNQALGFGISQVF